MMIGGMGRGRAEDGVCIVFTVGAGSERCIR